MGNKWALKGVCVKGVVDLQRILDFVEICSR